MSKTIRVYLVVAVLAVVGLFVGFRVLDPAQPLVGVLIAAMAAIGGLYLLRRESDDEGDFFTAPEEDEDRPRRKSSTATAEPLAAWEPDVAEAEPLATWEPEAAEAEPLATWEPEAEPLKPWTPPETKLPRSGLLDEAEPEVEEEEEELDLLDLEELEHIDEFVEAEAESGAWDEPIVEKSFEETVFEEPVFEESIEEPVAETASSSLFGRAAPIEEIEDVHSDDDIMKASHATELSVPAGGGGDNSELAKLLAKVQSRLAAYE